MSKNADYKENMAKKYFGTDGIRGTANSFPMTADMALKVAMATAHVLRQSQSERGETRTVDRVVIGKDTRLSCYMIEQAMASGFLAMGMDVFFTGPIPTPGVARLTYSMRADVGVMISASHNPFHDNGIKLFGADGYKLSDELEEKIEVMMDKDMSQLLASPDKVGKAVQLEDALARYSEYIKRSLDRSMSFEGLKVVIDCAHGSSYKVAPQTLWELEAEVITIGNRPNGRNINDGFGATSVESLQKTVVEEGADIGIALDGDADRIIVVDEKGQKIDGDQILALMALSYQEQGKLEGGVVATVMSNLGLERFLVEQGINFVRTPVGDRPVVEKMRESGYNIGGEQSGHIVLSDYTTTGDGLLAALHVLGELKNKNIKASELCNVFTPLPQLLKNVRYSGESPLGKAPVQDAIEKAEADLKSAGRVLVRASGTEPLIRVMAEGDDEKLIENTVNNICHVIEENAA